MFVEIFPEHEINFHPAQRAKPQAVWRLLNAMIK